MTKEEYFGEWLNALPTKEMQEVISRVSPIRNKICPAYKDIFKAFNKCPYRKLRLVIVGQEPYSQKNVATGLAFANFNNIPEKQLSPSLQVIKESIINYEIPHNLITFASELEEWAEQGVLLLNTALTCEINKPLSHSLLWRPFISQLIKNICNYNSGIVWLLLGSSAQSFKSYINKILIELNGYGITFYKEKYESSLY